MDSITLKQMRYALAVEKNGHFGHAAKDCFVTQSALSQQISQLEDQLGIAIFERNGKSILVTHAGAEFLKQAKRIVDQTRALEEQFALGNSADSLTISVAVIPTIAPYLLPTLLPALGEKFTPVGFSVNEKTTEQLIEAVLSGQCDCGILATEPTNEKLNTLPLFSDPFVLAVAPNDTLSGPVDLASLPREEMLLLSEGHCLRDQAMDACKIGDNLKQKTYAATSLSTIVELVANQMGMTLLPAISIKREALGGRVKTLSLTSSGAGRTVWFVWRKSTPFQQLFKDISQVVSKEGKALLSTDSKS